MLKSLFILIMAAGAAFSQYKVEPAGPPPSDLPGSIAATLQKDGAKVAGGGMPVCELWLVSTAPTGPKTTEEGVSLPTIPQGALLGVLRFTRPGSDRRGQTIKPGVYTLRYSLQPVNGDHQGVAPQRDFLVMIPVADDTKTDVIANIDDLMKMSRKASGTPHPAVLSMSSSSNSAFPDLKKEGDSDWVLHAKIGDLPVAVIVVGKVE